MFISLADSCLIPLLKFQWLNNKLPHKIILMKRIIFTLVCLLCYVCADAVTFDANGISYTVTSTSDLTVSVCSKRPKYSGDVNIPETVTYNGKEFTVTGIDFGTFVDCTGLKSVSIPKTISNIDKQLFNNTMALTKITVSNDNPYFCDVEGVLFNKDVTTLYYYPNAKGNSYTLPTTTKEIADECGFSTCWSLKSLTLNEGLEKIGKQCFYYDKFETLTLPSTLTLIGDYAFQRVTTLKTLYCKSETPCSLGTNAFNDDMYLFTTLYVPTGSKEAYQSAKGWKNFGTIEEYEPSSISSVVDNNKTGYVEYDILGRISSKPGLSISNGKVIYKIEQ